LSYYRGWRDLLTGGFGTQDAAKDKNDFLEIFKLFSIKNLWNTVSKPNHYAECLLMEDVSKTDL
jgi:hypothetical protein